MGKQGPCCHCGATSTPLWRNGPPEKPVLCNACGSRWRTKGSLANYTPSHVRDCAEEPKIRKPSTTTLRLKGERPPKKAPEQLPLDYLPCSDQNFRKAAEIDSCNRSSTGSAISYSESCAHYNVADACDFTGNEQSNMWDYSLPIPSKTRTTIARPARSSIQKLADELYNMYQEQQSSSSHSAPLEEDLLYTCDNPSATFEIGYGSELIRRPSVKSVDEESEATSLLVDGRSVNIDDKSEKLNNDSTAGGLHYVSRNNILSEKLGMLRNADDSSSTPVEIKMCGKKMTSGFAASSSLMIGVKRSRVGQDYQHADEADHIVRAGSRLPTSSSERNSLVSNCLAVTIADTDEGVLVEAPIPNTPLADAEFLTIPWAAQTAHKSQIMYSESCVTNSPNRRRR